MKIKAQVGNHSVGNAGILEVLLVLQRVCLAETLASAEVNNIAAYPMPALVINRSVLSVLWLAFGSLLRIFRDRQDLIFEKCVPRQQLTVVRTEYLAATGYL